MVEAEAVAKASSRPATHCEPNRKAWFSTWITTPFACPVRAVENSPAIYRGVQWPVHETSPGGTIEGSLFSRPSGTDWRAREPHFVYNSARVVSPCWCARHKGLARDYAWASYLNGTRERRGATMPNTRCLLKRLRPVRRRRVSCCGGLW